ncbi:MAG: glucoamylase [Rhodospirillales bacterium]|nr:glucoamylase [Rhodospirillales bacterium]
MHGDGEIGRDAVARRIEDYALIGDTHTAALVGRDGSIDWLCLPRFDAPACFARMLGDSDNGRWLIAPAQPVDEVRRRYRDGTLILETEFVTASGAVTLIDFMPRPSAEDRTDVIRILRCTRGTVAMVLDLVLRFDYGRVAPWVRRRRHGIFAVAGPDAIEVHTPVPLTGENFRTVAEFTISAGQEIPFALTRYPSHKHAPRQHDCAALLEDVESGWRRWSSRCTYEGAWKEPVQRSLITLKALTYSPTGGIVAAPTTSLPERLGGERNWDYRFCWIRDATLTLYSLIASGYTDEAMAWREWLLRAAAGKPSELQIMYGIAGERRLDELELPWLSGFAGSQPVRIGNAAHAQLQLDVYGELMDALHATRKHGLDGDVEAWRLQTTLLDFLEDAWTKPDSGLWEIRGPERHFTHSKVMAWVGVDRSIAGVESFGLDGPVERWRELREIIHADICRNGFDEQRNSFVQYYGGRELDASLLLLPTVGFLPASDPRMLGTVEAIERELVVDGLVKRYSTSSGVDGLPQGEGAFLACTFWYVDALALLGRYRQAEEIFEKLLSLRNDVGLLAEEYDPKACRQLGNFPQAFSHIALINSARSLSEATRPATERASRTPSVPD